MKMIEKNINNNISKKLTAFGIIEDNSHSELRQKIVNELIKEIQENAIITIDYKNIYNDTNRDSTKNK